MDFTLLKTLLNFTFYTEHKSNLTPSLFEDELRETFEIITGAHAKYEHDLTPTELLALWMDKNPVATKASVEAFKGVVDDVESSDSLSDDLAGDIIHKMWQRHIGTQIANYGIEIADNNPTSMGKLEELLAKSKDGFLPTDFGETTTQDVEVLLTRLDDESAWKFNINTLAKHISGIGPSDFASVFALTNTGKTAFITSLCTGPGGFCSQGARVLVLGNEEWTGKTMLRAIQSCSGMTKQQVIRNPEEAKRRFAPIKDKFSMNEIHDWDYPKVEAYIEQTRPDIVILDAADKISIGGSFGSEVDRLKELYRRIRETAKRYECAMIAVGQANGTVEGRTVLTQHDMEGSKVAKQQHLDLILGIGKTAEQEEGEEYVDRYITVGKNKLSGWHGTIATRLQQQTCRYLA
tara:strand:+ start:2372 stop:3589 length:1218 start_codon:yes stop_codon:yes gene_type:complete